MPSSVLRCEPKEPRAGQQHRCTPIKEVKAGRIFETSGWKVNPRPILDANPRGYEPESYYDITGSLLRYDMLTPKNATEENREDHGIPAKKRRLFSSPNSEDMSAAQLSWHAVNSIKSLSNDSSNNDDGGPNLIRTPEISKADWDDLSKEVHAKSEPTEIPDTWVQSDVLPLAYPANLIATANDDRHPALHTSKSGVEANKLHFILPNAKAMKSKNCFHALDSFISTLCRTSVDDSYKKSEKLGVRTNHISGTEGFDFRSIANNFEVHVCFESKDAGSRSSELQKVLEEQLVSVNQVDCGMSEVPRSEVLKVADNCDPKNDDMKTWPAQTPELTPLAPNEGSMVTCSTNSFETRAKELEAPRSHQSDHTEHMVVQNKINVDLHPSIATQLKRRSPAVMDCPCQLSHNSASPSEVLSSDIHQEVEKSETDYKHSSDTNDFNFSAINKNFDNDSCVMANSARCGFPKKPEPRREHVLPQSDIPTVVEECANNMSSNLEKIAFWKHNKRQRYEFLNKNLEKVGMFARSEFSETFPGITRYSSIARWTGGDITVFSQPNFDREERISESDKDTGSAEDLNFCGISMRNGHEGDAVSNQLETSGVSINGGGRASANTSPSEAIYIDGYGRRDSPDSCDANLLENILVTNDLGSAGDSNNDSIAVASRFDTTAAADNLLGYKYRLSKKLVDADANLTEDVGDEAEKVVTYRDSPDSDVSVDSLSYLVSSIIMGTPGHLQCSFCHQIFTCYTDLEGHSVERHPEEWMLKKNSFLRTLVPYHPEGFMANHPDMKFKCIFCSRLFSCYSTLLGHLTERHSGDEPYGCPFCSERFKDAVSYSNHLDVHVLLTNYPSYKCQTCTLCFSAQWQLDLHAEVHERLSPIIVD